MDWNAEIDGYCERRDPSLWAEPLNAVTNLAFLLAAAVMWWRLGRAPAPLERTLCVVLAAIGVASGMFHTYAVGWTAALDSGAILVFVLVYLFAANRVFWGQSRGRALLLTGLFFPYAAVLVPLFLRIPGLDGSAVYAPVPLLILAYGIALWRDARATAAGLIMGAAILILSLTFRTLDSVVCPVWPQGTHFLWHVLNGIMLGWMIEVLRRHPRPDQSSVSSVT